MNTSKLIRLISASGYKRSFIAQTLGISENSFRNKINGKAEFRVSEIEKLRDFLGISTEDFLEAFFS